MMLLRRLLGGAASPSTSLLTTFTLLSALVALPVHADDVLETNGFSTCLDSNNIVVTVMDLKYDRSTGAVTYDLEGTSASKQEITAVMSISAYGKQVYSTDFDPCEKNITSLCPLPEGSFSAVGAVTISSDIASSIPEIAFKVPDLDGLATLQLKSKDSGEELACLTSAVANGKTANVVQAKYATAAIAAGALLAGGVGAMGASGGATAVGASSPNFGDVMFWFQNIATDGMLTLSYPAVYRAFTSNFQWSTGLFGWDGMQQSIDNFRKSTGGNTTTMSIQYLLHNTTLVYDKSMAGGTASTNSKMRRDLMYADEDSFGGLWARDSNVTVSSNSTSSSGSSKVMTYVEGIQAKVEALKIPSANTFMTVLLIFLIVIASIAVCILLFKVILEVWALFKSFPKGLTGFRKRYWSFLVTTIVRIILILYGTWTLYCFYQFRNGDSWGAHLLAALTLVAFTGVLGFFAWRIITVAQHSKKSEHGQEQLFMHKPYMRKYGIFYDSFRSDFWWIFLPLIVYSFAKGAIIALGDGHGLVQTIGQLICELGLLILLLWNRPYNTRAGNILNITISCVRVLSVVCLIVFVDQLGIAADTKTVTGVALIVIQSTLTAVLAICIAVNAISAVIKENPYVKKRKEQEKLRDGDLTALDARNSLLSGAYANDGKGHYSQAPVGDQFYTNEGMQQQPTIPMHSMEPAGIYHQRNFSEHSGRGLVGAAAPMSMVENEYGEFPPTRNNDHMAAKAI